MKRKKWTEEEESTLISTYAELQRSGALSKLKKREKKFEPIAQRLNAVHHMSNPTSFPFRWTWHDVSVKVQNMRHQFLNVKQKIRLRSPTSDSTTFNWVEGQNHWHNFLKYKDVFGDLDLDSDPALPLPPPPPPTSNDAHHSNGGDGDDDDGEREDDKDQASASASALLVVDDEAAAAVFGYDGFVDGDGPDVLGMGLGLDYEDGFEADRDEELEPAVSDGEERDGAEDGENGDLGFVRQVKRAKKRSEDCGGGRVLELREMMVRREERREREFRREEEEAVRENRRREKEREKEEQMSSKEFELWEREKMWVRRESERRMRVEVELEEEKRWRMKLEEKREEEEMEWRERMVEMQFEHEKKMMEMHAEACHNQMQVLGVLMRLVGQFFGPGGDGLGAAIGGGLPLQNLQQHPGSLVGENGKADGSSGAHFM